MVVVKIELWPGGYEGLKQEIGRMHITNTGESNSEKRGDYTVQLMRRGTPNSVVRTAEVRGYPRLSYPVWELVRRAISGLYKKGVESGKGDSA